MTAIGGTRIFFFFFQILEELQNINCPQSFIESNNLNSGDVLLNWMSYLYNMYIAMLIMKYILSLYEVFSVCENSHNDDEFFY